MYPLTLSLKFTLSVVEGKGALIPHAAYLQQAGAFRATPYPVIPVLDTGIQACLPCQTRRRQGHLPLAEGMGACPQLDWGMCPHILVPTSGGRPNTFAFLRQDHQGEEAVSSPRPPVIPVLDTRIPGEERRRWGILSFNIVASRLHLLDNSCIAC